MRSTSTIDMPPLRELSNIAAENNPNRIAFGNGIEGDVVTWSEFDVESSRAANAIQEYAAQGDRVAFLCESSVEHTTLWNGALKAGCVVSNLHVRESATTTRSCIDSLRPRVLVVGEETSKFFETEVRDYLTTDIDIVVTTDEPLTGYEQDYDSFLSGNPDTAPDVRVREDDVAAVIWTSGTTGEPKGWCQTNRGLMLRGMKLANKKGTTRLTRVPNVFTPSFAAWYSTTIPTMLANGGTFFQKSWEPEKYVELIEERELTSCILVPTMWREILRLETLDQYDLSSLIAIESAGETLDTTTLKQLQEEVCESVSQAYAATEVVGTTISDTEMDEQRIDSVGKPLLGTRIRVIERGGSPSDTLPPGEVGEIIIKGSDAAVWVWGNTAKTEACFENGWWYSDDLGYKDEDGYLYIQGRDDNMILSKGIKVFPTPIEERLNTHPDVIESAIVGIKDDEYGERVTAYVYRSDLNLTAEELDEWCLDSSDLSRLERPREYYFTDDSLPRTSSDKLDRKSIQRELSEQ